MTNDTMKKPAILAAALAILAIAGVTTFKKTNSGLKNAKEAIENSSGDEQRSLAPWSNAKRACIISLITPDTNLSELCRTLRTLVNMEGDEGRAPIFLFDSVSLLPETQKELKSCTDRYVEFKTQSFFDYPFSFPDGIDLQRIDSKRFAYDQWEKEQEERWWTSRVWLRPCFEQFEVIMRIGHESCFSAESSFLPGFSDPEHQYHAHAMDGGYEIVRKKTEGLYEFAKEYLRENGLEPANPYLWSMLTNMYNDFGTLPYFSNEFEIIHKSFVLRKDVKAWHDALTDTEPFGFYRYGWTVGHARFLTAAIFGSPDMVHIKNIEGYMRKDLASGALHPEDCM